MVQRWGLGSWAVKQPNPTQLLWRPASPLGCEGGRSARPSQKVGGVWAMDGYWLSRPGYLGSAVYTPPPDPPLSSCTWFPDITSGNLVQDEAGAERVWVPIIPVGGDEGFFVASTPRVWELSRWGLQAKKPFIVLNGWLTSMMIMTWADVIQNAPPPFPKTCGTKNFNKCLATQKNHCWKSQFSFQLDYKNAFLKIIPKIAPKKQNHYWKHWMIKSV